MSGENAFFSNIYEFSFLLFGSGLIALSSGFGLIAGFKGSFLGVYSSLIVFVSGYKIAQIGLHNGKNSGSIFAYYFKKFRHIDAIDFLSFLGGSIFMSFGFMLLTRSIQNSVKTLGIAAAIIMGAGYMLTHWAINNTLV